MSELGRFVLRRLNEVGLTQAEAARRGAFTRQSLGNWINGHVRTVQLRSIISLATVLEVSPYHLLRLMCREMGVHLVADERPHRPGDHARFVVDLDTPDNTVVHVGERFTKGWRIQNTGTVAWSDRWFECIDVPPASFDGTVPLVGYLRPIRRRLPVPRTAPGDTVDLIAEFIAPDVPGTVRSSWKFVESGGEFCFPDHVGAYCQVRVVSLV